MCAYIRTYLIIVQGFSQVHFLAEGEVLHAQPLRHAPLLPQVKVPLDLWERPQATPTWGDVADVHPHLVGPYPLADEATPAVCNERGCDILRGILRR